MEGISRITPAEKKVVAKKESSVLSSGLSDLNPMQLEKVQKKVKQEVIKACEKAVKLEEENRLLKEKEKNL